MLEPHRFHMTKKNLAVREAQYSEKLQNMIYPEMELDS